MRSCSWNPPMSQLATKRKIHKSSKHLSLDYFLSLHTVVQSAWLVLFNLPMCVRKRSWIDLPFTLSKPQLGSPLVVVNSKWLPLLAVSPFSPTCWSSLPSHFSLMTSQPSAPCLFLYSCSLFAGSNSVFALELPWIMLPTFLHPEKLLTPRRTVSGQRPCRAKCLGSDSICPGCSGSGFLSQLRIPTHIFCRQNSSEHKGYPASPSHLSCAWLTAHSQPWCCAKSSHRDFRTNTLLSPTLEHPLVLPVAPAYLHIIYGSALPASLRVSLLHRSERKPYRLCPSQQWCVQCLCNHRPPISMETAAGGKGQFFCLQCQLVSVGLALWPFQAWPLKSQCQCFAESPVLSLCITMCCQASASESWGREAASCILAGHFLLLLGLLVHPQRPGLG